MKQSAALIACAIAICANLALSATLVAPADGKALLVGTDTSKMRVLFRKLDDGAVLWTSPTSLGTNLTVEPGHHNLNVMCQFKSPGMTQFVPGDVVIDVEVGRTYDVTGRLDSHGKCNVTVSVRS